MGQRRQSFDKRIVISAVLVALSVIILYLGCAIEVLDLTMSAIVSLLVVVIVIELGYKYAWFAYLATSVLSLLLLPQKTPAIFYACFMGFYPIIKSHTERINSAILRWTIKLVAGNVALIAMLWLICLFTPEEFENVFMIVSAYILGLAAFVMYDIALTKLITVYFAKVRDRIKIYKFLR